MITYQVLAAEAETRWHPDPVRLSKAIQIAAEKHSIYNRDCAPGCWDVRSQTALNSWHHVNTHTHTCTCRDSQLGNVCKHRLAVWLYVEQITRSMAQVSHRPESIIMRELGYA